MTTVADVIAKARNDYLMAGARDARNRLASAITDTTSSTITLTYDLAGIGRDAKLTIDLEDFHVYDTTDASKSAIVGRGEFGSTAATHLVDSVVLVNPRYTNAQILRAVNDELSSLSSPTNGLFKISHVDLTFNASVMGYDLTSVTDVLSIIDVRYQAIGSDADWPLLPGSMWTHGRNMSTGSFPSGHALFLRGEVDPGRTVRVSYRAPFTALSALTDDVVAVSGLPATATDLLALGAAIRLTAGTEVQRNRIDTQGDTRRAQEVPAGANLGANRGLMAARAQRIAEERSRLDRAYPMRLG